MSGLFHGGRLGEAIARYGGDRDDWLDLSTGINPHAYPVPEMGGEIWQRLPEDGQMERLLDAAREAYCVREDMQIVAANGTQAIIERLPGLFEPTTVCIVSPTYGEHAHAWERAGHDARLVRSIDDMEDGSIGVVVNPNNPNGRRVEPAQMKALATRLEALIVDEAFCDPVPELSCVPTMPDNVVVMRSFGKFYGLAGLRLGFAIGNHKLMTGLEQACGPWAVSGPAIAIGTIALADRDWRAAMRVRLEKASEQLADALGRNGFEVVGCNALFVYARHVNAAEIYEHLAQNHILVRHFPERPGFLRFGLCGNDETFKRLSSVLEAAS